MYMDLGNMINAYTTITPQTIGTTGSASATGVGVDRRGYESAVFVFESCQPIGTPTGVTLTCKVQDSSDNSSFTDITDASSSHVITNTYAQVEVNLNLRSQARYVRGVATFAADGGSTPWVIVSATCILGAAKEYPV